MAWEYDEQFVAIVARASISARAHVCDGDAGSAVVWDPASEITIRLSLRQDEVWLVAGSGTLLRFVAASDGEFDHEGIDSAIGLILRGEAVEHFGVAGHRLDDVFATGYRAGEKFAGGLTVTQSLFQARIAGPMASARMDIPD